LGSRQYLRDNNSITKPKYIPLRETDSHDESIAVFPPDNEIRNFYHYGKDLDKVKILWLQDLPWGKRSNNNNIVWL